MTTTLNLTFEEGRKVIEAMKNVATEHDWTDEEIVKLDIIEQYTSAVDAALAAMGISVSIAGEPEVEVEDDGDFDHEVWKEDEKDGYFNSDYEDEDEEDDDELPSDDEVFNLIRRVLYGR